MATPDPNRRTHKTHAPLLSAREIRFCQMLVTDDVTQFAAYVACFGPRGDRPATDKAASRLVRKREIREYMRHLQHVAAETAKLTVEELAAFMANVVKADRRKLYDARGNILPPDQWPDDVAATVEQVESEELFEPVPGERGKKRLKGYARKIKTASRVQAAAKLMEWKKMLGHDKAEGGKAAPDPLVVGGGADPGNL